MDSNNTVFGFAFIFVLVVVLVFNEAVLKPMGMDVIGELKVLVELF